MSQASATHNPQSFDMIALGFICRELLAEVERFPGAGDAIHARETRWTGGGMAANVAHAVARLGGRVAMVCAIGDDTFGDELVQMLERDTIHTDHVFRRQGQPTPIVLLMVDPARRRAGLVLNTATHDSLHSGEVPDALLDATRVFFTDLNPPVPALEVARRAKQRGAVVAFDMQMAAEHINLPDLNQSVTAMTETSDFCFADEENFLLWWKRATLAEAMADAVAAHPSVTFVVTRGAAGAQIGTATDAWDVGAFPVRMVDSIGAGDAFHAAFLYAHLSLGWSLRSAGVVAAAAAALSCRAAGARDGLPTLAEVVDFLQEDETLIPELQQSASVQ